MSTTAVCQRTRALIPRLIDGDLSPEERSEVDRHLATCDACRDEQAAARRALDALQSLSPEDRARLRESALAELGLGEPPARGGWVGRMLLIVIAALVVWFALRLRGDRTWVPDARSGASTR